MTDFLSFGEPLPEGVLLASSRAKTTAALCERHPSFALLERCQHTVATVGLCDVLVVDCVNDQVPTQNKVGIRVRERIALVFPHDERLQPQVRMLRADFPVVAHLNYVPQAEPSSLCLYFEPWTTIERTWTPQKHLQRILSWLEGTATGSLHRIDQPLEQLYYDSPIDVVLPPDLVSRPPHVEPLLHVEPVERDAHRMTCRVVPVPVEKGEVRRNSNIVPIVVNVAGVVHGRVERLPETLGALQDQLAERGASLLEPLRAAICEQVPSAGVSQTNGKCLLLLKVPVRRESNAEPESHDFRGFVLPLDLATFGAAVGALSLVGEHYYAVPLLGKASAPQTSAWLGFALAPVNVRFAATPEFASQASGVMDKADKPHRILAGVGALGSSLAEIWSREGWGDWTFVDPDYVQPHNLVRHIATPKDVGRYKVEVVKEWVNNLFSVKPKLSVAIRASVLDQNAEIAAAFKESSLLVDASTTFEVPRDLSVRDDVCRTTTVFLTPSGDGAVLLLEDAGRKIRLDVLEPQYYAAILCSTWGERHLAGHAGDLWIGAGCRDVSRVLSFERIQLHAALLAQQVRVLTELPTARIRVWTVNTDTGAIAVDEIAICESRIELCNGWEIVSNRGVEAKLVSLRQQHLPSETGGVVLGYADHVRRRLYIVDVLAAPSDSDGNEAGFTRGVHGLREQIERAGKRTGNIVTYLGEWHSHPTFHPPVPSRHDQQLLSYLANVQKRDGEPALTVIVGAANQVSYQLLDMSDRA